MKFIKIFLMLTVLTAGILGAIFYVQVGLPKNPGSTEVIEFDVLKGARPVEIARSLESAGIIRNSDVFLWLGRFKGYWSRVRAADYELNAGMTPEEIFKVFLSGVGIQRSVLLREGENIFHLADALQKVGIAPKERVLGLVKSRNFISELGLSDEGVITLEGYLFPNTYFYDRKDRAESILKRMVDAFLRSWTPAFEARAKELGLTRLQVVTLASMIEKETGADFERPLIASVFHNRIQKKMRLQSDPTTIYGMWESYQGNLKRSDLLKPSAYNTYTLPGLPVGPIANPHPDSIRAALYPADSDFLYFVSKNDGTHVFSKTYTEHADWVKKLQMDAKAREGKSWRDRLNKNQ